MLDTLIDFTQKNSNKYKSKILFHAVHDVVYLVW